MSNLLQIRKMTFLCDKHYMQGTIVAMAAKMPKVILTEYGVLACQCSHYTHPLRESSAVAVTWSSANIMGSSSKGSAEDTMLRGPKTYREKRQRRSNDNAHSLVIPTRIAAHSEAGMLLKHHTRIQVCASKLTELPSSIQKSLLATQSSSR